MRKLLVLAVAAQLFGTSSAFAAAFELREFSAGAMGSAYAGAAANDQDPGSLFYNPATLGGVSDWDASLDATGLLLNSGGHFTGTTAFGTSTGGTAGPHAFIGDALVPAIALRYRLTDRWAVGLTLSTPFGESTDYPATWTGRYYAQNTDLVVYNATPMISYQLLPELTLAAGAQVQYVRSFLTEAVDFGTIGAVSGIPGAAPGADDGRAVLHGHGWGAGYVLGALWQPLPPLSLGLSYHSGIPQGLKGTETFAYDTAGIGATINALTGAFANSQGKADVPTPATLTGGARWRVADRWTALAGVEYTNWSSFRQLLIRSSNPANPADLTVTNWKNTWFGSLGLEYRPDDTWTWRLGTAYDEAAVPAATVTPRIPDANRYWLSGGLGYRWNGATELNFAVSHLFAPHSTIAQSDAGPGNTFRGSLTGVSNTNATLIGAQIVLQ